MNQSLQSNLEGQLLEWQKSKTSDAEGGVDFLVVRKYVWQINVDIWLNTCNTRSFKHRHLPENNMFDIWIFIATLCKYILYQNLYIVFICLLCCFFYKGNGVCSGYEKKLYNSLVNVHMLNIKYLSKQLVTMYMCI